MSQVIVEVGSPAQTGGSTVWKGGAVKSSEVTSSGTAASVKIDAQPGSIVTIHNNGSDAIWARFDGTAAVTAGHFLSPNTSRDFSGIEGTSLSIINDS